MSLLNYLLLAALLAPAYSMECFRCDSRFNCTQRTVRCQEGQKWCRALLHQGSPVNDTQQFIQKGCAWRESGNQTISYTSGMFHFVQSEYFCGTNLCNMEDPAEVPVSVEPNGFQCHACNEPATSCNKTDIAVQNCTGLANQCLTISFSILIGEGTGVSKDGTIHGGCTYNPSCTTPLGYQTVGISSLFECCNSSLCNNATMGFLEKTETSNGVKCFSCEGVQTSGCSIQNETEIECIGPMSMCMEAVATDELRNVTVNIKGCATPAWCHRPIYQEYQTADFQRVQCCQGNLCNGQEVTATTAAASAKTKPRPKIHSNGGSLVVCIPQITAALLLIATSWNLLMFPGF